MMSREWVKDTREAWERAANEALRRAGQGERIDRRSLAERRDEAERAGDLEQAAELSRKPNVHLGPQAYRAGDLEREGRGEKKRGFGCGPTGWSRTIRRFGRSGTASSSGSRRGSRGSIGSFRRSGAAPGHFMDNEDTRVPTVHIGERRAYHRRHAAGTLGRSHGQYRPDSSWRTTWRSFLDELGISQYRLAKVIGTPPRRINEIVHGRRSITADTAVRLGQALGITPEFWLNLQNLYDLDLARASIDIGSIESLSVEPHSHARSIPGQAIRKLKAADRKAGDTPEGCFTPRPTNSHTTPSP